jgi:membrane protease YdiL (CAAX protease family)
MDPVRLRRRAFWWAVLLGAPPIAWIVAARGFGIAVRSPLADVAWLLLWSAAEELIFRGGVQRALERLFERSPRPMAAPPGVTAANLLTSVLFAAAHLLDQSPAAAHGIFPVSLVLGASLERSGHLAVPVALHAYFNLLLYAASALQRA